MSIVCRTKTELAEILNAKGFASVAQASGSNNRKYLSHELTANSATQIK